jgi:hypothetical protein
MPSAQCLNELRYRILQVNSFTNSTDCRPEPDTVFPDRTPVQRGLCSESCSPHAWLKSEGVSIMQLQSLHSVGLFEQQVA